MIVSSSSFINLQTYTILSATTNTQMIDSVAAIRVCGHKGDRGGGGGAVAPCGTFAKHTYILGTGLKILYQKGGKI